MYDLLIGTRDWQNTVWSRKFYPDNLPDDWRFCFYSNQFRSVLIPGTVWESVTTEDISAWVEDSDDEFKVVCELPARFSEIITIPELQDRWNSFQEITAPLANQMAVYLWSPSAKQLQQADFLSGALDILSQAKPVSLLLTGKQTENLQVPGTRASICWSVANSEKPEPHGDFLVALCQENDLKRVRVVIEKLGEWMGEDRQAVLIFEGDNALVQSQQARMIAEMMAV
ncbi:MAG: DUF72 domain-containing protein [Acidiferrobacterales bacterium]